MDSSSTPPLLKSNPLLLHQHSNSHTNKSASRLSRITHAALETEDHHPIPHLNLDLITSPSSLKSFSTTAPLSPSLQELLLLSPSPLRRSRTRLADRLEMAAADEAPGGSSNSKRRSKSRTTSQSGGMGYGGSPRNNRRLRRRSEVEMRDDREREPCMAEDIGKPRRRKHWAKSKKDKLCLVPFVAPPPPASIPSPKLDDDDDNDNFGHENLDRIGQIISDMVMWRDAAKSTLWFGLGCVCFLSSWFAKGINFSIFSVISQLGILWLGASFISNSISQRNNVETKRDFRLKEYDILRLSRLILSAQNLAISKTGQLFSGEPSMTLKVVPFLLLGAEYGHLITVRRLFALGFFISFTVPKLYSSYSSQIYQKVENMKRGVLDAWGACSHKKIVAASALTAFWNLSSVKTRVFTAFMALVILRYCRQYVASKEEGHLAEPEAEEKPNEEPKYEQQQELEQAIVVAEPTASQQPQSYE